MKIKRNFRCLFLQALFWRDDAKEFEERAPFKKMESKN